MRSMLTQYAQAHLYLKSVTKLGPAVVEEDTQATAMFEREVLNYVHIHEAKTIPPRCKRPQHIKVLTCFCTCTRGNRTAKVVVSVPSHIL